MNRSVISRYRRIVLRSLPPAASWLGTLLASVLIAGPFRGSGAVVAILVVVLVRWLRDRDGDAAHVAPVAVLAAVAGFSGRQDALLATAASLLLLAALATPWLERLIRPRLSAHRLPGLLVPAVDRVSQPVFTATCAGVIVLAAAVALPLPASVALVLVAATLLAGAVVAGLQVLRLRRHQPEREIREALTTYAPDYLIHYSGRPEGAYQVQMWLPYLERTGARGALLVREAAFLDTALRITSMPVLLAEKVEPIEHVIVPGLAAIFYVNNAAKNVDGIRYAQVTHVHLGHGDSEKPPSYAASTAMFDRIFVAGEAGVDRFASHGVLVPREKFVLVGRPQVEAIDVRPASSQPAARPTVLYAPTWRGSLNDMQLSSLDAGVAIVSALLAAGARVIFRPHPFSSRDAASRVLVQRIDALLAGSDHLTSRDATALTIFECMNRSDALVGDVSSVVSDYLYSNKPIALAHHSGDRVEQEYPVARGTYLLSVDGDIAAGLRDLLGADPLAPERAEVRRYYLGPWPADGYSQVFVDAATAVIRERPAAG